MRGAVRISAQVNHAAEGEVVATDFHDASVSQAGDSKSNVSFETLSNVELTLAWTPLPKGYFTSCNNVTASMSITLASATAKSLTSLVNPPRLASTTTRSSGTLSPAATKAGTL